MIALQIEYFYLNTCLTSKHFTEKFDENVRLSFSINAKSIFTLQETVGSMVVIQRLFESLMRQTNNRPNLLRRVFSHPDDFRGKSFLL